ncbi:MAG TPA: TetR/AcrR family transcriptional regulator [Solirubrobacteraceae bacterium]|nr:TetR/AcrR family transcriptional regulator [Solirubrobacteraceae bacterium]
MSREQTHQTDGNDRGTTGRKDTQRARLLNAAVDVVARDGYARATIASVIAQAGVSRPTFYDYFSDKDDCLLAATAEVHRRLYAATALALERGAPEHAIRSAIATLVEFARSEPAAARMLINEALAGGPRALDARDEQIAELAQLVRTVQARAPAGRATPDVSVRMMLGAIHRLLATRLRDESQSMEGLADELQRWSESYELPRGQHRWSSLAPAPAAPPSPLVARTPLRPPAPLRGGRHSKEKTAENHRQRLMFAAAEAARQKGYTAMSIADIVKIAGLDHRAFASVFADKKDAYMAIAEHGFERTMAVTAGAFFSGSSWPERTWEAGRAFTQFLQNNPAITIIFVESYAVGPNASKRFDDLLNAFTLFLQLGYEEARDGRHPSSVALEAIATTNFEMGYHQARGSAGPQITELQPHSIFVLLAPFIGPDAANRFIDEQLPRA